MAYGKKTMTKKASTKKKPKAKTKKNKK